MVSSVPVGGAHPDPDAAGDSSTGGEIDMVAERFRRQSQAMHPRAPLYVTMCEIIARRHEVLELLLHAPPTQRLPVLLLAAVHAEVLDNPDAALSDWYPNVTSTPRSPDAEHSALETALVAFCHERGDRIAAMCATRATQTNEIGRCALFVPVFALVAEEMGELAHLDVGASAGLNLMWNRYRYRYEPGAEVGPVSDVVLTCGTRGAVPVPDELPRVHATLGLDREPIDITDPSQARWLEACVWPDQLDRFSRLRAAATLAADDPPHVIRGDAIDDLPTAVTSLRPFGHPVVTNSWVLNYLTARQRRDYLATLERLGSSHDLTWVFVESPQYVPELPVEPVVNDESARDQTVLTLVRWRGGNRRVDHLGVCHPHGYWLHWRPPGPPNATGGPERG